VNTRKGAAHDNVNTCVYIHMRFELDRHVSTILLLSSAGEAHNYTPENNVVEETSEPMICRCVEFSTPEQGRPVEQKVQKS
jgi:hypothetical protein